MKWIIEQLRKGYERLLAISSERWFFFSLGLIITAFGAITLHIEWAPILLISVCAIHAFARAWKEKPFLWKDYIAALIGALIIWLITLM